MEGQLFSIIIIIKRGYIPTWERKENIYLLYIPIIDTYYLPMLVSVSERGKVREGGTKI